jgi:tRNA uridine 5-carboxymethylaminomethyl modification enzyme
MIDDLITKEIREPYRMFTSRAEHRLLLRGDNADLRLTPLAHEWGMVDARRAEAVACKQQQSAELQAQLETQRIFPTAATNALLGEAGVAPLRDVVSVAELLRRPHISYRQIQAALDLPDVPDYISEQAELAARYGTYIDRQQREAERVRKMEDRRLPPDFDYATVQGLRNEARHTLERLRPATLGQASRLAGVNPSDISLILFALERQEQVRRRLAAQQH